MKTLKYPPADTLLLCGISAQLTLTHLNSLFNTLTIKVVHQPCSFRSWIRDLSGRVFDSISVLLNVIGSHLVSSVETYVLLGSKSNSAAITPIFPGSDLDAEPGV